MTWFEVGAIVFTVLVLAVMFSWQFWIDRQYCRCEDCNAVVLRISSTLARCPRCKQLYEYEKRWKRGDRLDR